MLFRLSFILMLGIGLLLTGQAFASSIQSCQFVSGAETNLVSYPHSINNQKSNYIDTLKLNHSSKLNMSHNDKVMSMMEHCHCIGRYCTNSFNEQADFIITLSIGSLIPKDKNLRLFTQLRQYISQSSLSFYRPPISLNTSTI